MFGIVNVVVLQFYSALTAPFVYKFIALVNVRFWLILTVGNTLDLGELRLSLLGGYLSE